MYSAKKIFYEYNLAMKMFLLLITFFISQVNLSFGQDSVLKPIPFDAAWKQKIFDLAPETPSVPISKKHKVLLFSLFTGFNHWIIPHVEVVMEVLADKTGAFEIMQSIDISMFEKNNLKKFDAVILNNNCSVGDRRNLFYDALSADTTMSEKDKTKKAALLESNLLSFVKKGGGLAVLHGGIVMQNNSAEFSEMLGGSFDYHPPQQEIELKIVDQNHPMTMAFEGNSFTHIDEPYFFKNAYSNKDFRPLLFMELSKIHWIKHESEDTVSYVSWIKKYGKGRVFYVSPSHNAQSYENSRMLLFYLNGLQYVLGDLECADSPLE